MTKPSDARDRSMCNDWGDNPDCLGVPDPQYDMDYTDVKPGEIIRWCKHCGPIWTPVNEAILNLPKDKQEELRALIDSAKDNLQ